MPSTLLTTSRGRLPGPAHERGKVLVERHQAVAPVHHEAEHRSLIHGGLRLLEDFRLEPAQPFGAVGYGMVAVERHAPVSIRVKERPLRERTRLPYGRG